MKIKNVYIIAGSNGAGKTTFAKKFLPQYAKCRNFINADLIACRPGIGRQMGKREYRYNYSE